MQDEIRRACEWVRRFCEVEQRGLRTQDALVQGSAGERRLALKKKSK